MMQKVLIVYVSWIRNGNVVAGEEMNWEINAVRTLFEVLSPPWIFLLFVLYGPSIENYKWNNKLRMDYNT